MELVLLSLLVARRTIAPPSPGCVFVDPITTAVGFWRWARRFAARHERSF